MSLRKKSLVIIGITLASLIIIIYTTSRIFLLNSYKDLEKEYMYQNIELLQDILSDKVGNLNNLAGDWANWDDTYEFMDNHTLSYLQNNFHDNDFINGDFNFVILADTSGLIVFDKGFDLENKKEIPVPDSLRRLVTPESILVNFADSKKSISGIISFPENVLLIAARPILNSKYCGPAKGTLIMGRYLDSVEINHLGEISNLTLTLKAVKDKSLSVDSQSAYESLLQDDHVAIVPMSTELVAGYTLLQDIYGKRNILMQVNLNRKIFQSGVASFNYFMYFFLLAALVVIVLTMIFLEKKVLSRLEYLSNCVSDIGSSISTRIVITGKDELSNLAGSINSMLDELEEYHNKLMISEARLQCITNNMLDIVTQVNIKGIIEYISPSCKTVLGHEMHELLDESILNYIHPDNLQFVSSVFRSENKDISSLRTEIRCLHKDGCYLWMETNGNTVFDNNGQVTGFILVSREITERKQVEKALREAHEELEARVDERTDSLVKANTELKNEIIERERVQEVLQYQSNFEKLIAMISADFIKVDTEDIDRSINHALKTIGEYVGVDRSYVFLFYDENKLMNNTHEWCAPGITPQMQNLQNMSSNCISWWMNKLNRFENIYIPLVNDLPFEAEMEKKILQEQAIQSLVVVPIVYRKSLLGYLGFDWVREAKSSSPEQIILLRVVAELVANALERQRAEEVLAAEKSRLDVTLRNISDGVITIDLEQRIILINNTAAEITGWTPEDALQKYFNEVFCIIDKQTNQIVVDPAEKMMIKAQNDGLADNITLISKDGLRKIIDHKSNLLKDKEQNIIGYVLVFSDVTEQKKYEARLALSQKMESIGQLAAGIAHEINTPMQYIGDNNRFLQDAFSDISGYIARNNNLLMSCQNGHLSQKELDELLNQNTVADIDYLIREIPLAIEQSLEGIHRVNELVLAMKDFSHPGTKEKISVNINKGIEGTINISRNEWKYTAELEMDLDQNLPPVNCVIDEINQVILNMVVNAAHAVKEAVERGYYPKGKIYISTRTKSDAAEIRIQDNGIGIREELQHRVFDPFFTTKDVSKGTGQGLAIAHDIIVNKHQGSIQVESEEGTGTTFIICLPLT